jgi:glycosyltransferase involved in cell wall biosynthesis
LARIWLDVEDMFEYARGNLRPSGIQRVEYELCRALARLPDAAGRVGFVRHDASRSSLRIVPYAEFEATFSRLTTAARREEPGAPAQRPASFARRALRRIAYRLPSAARQPLSQIYLHQRASLAACGALLRAGWAGVQRRVRQTRRPAATIATPRERPANAGRTQCDAGPADSVTDDHRVAQAGDVLAVLGSPWFPGYARLAAQSQLGGLRLALLIYDLIPIRRPEWCERDMIALFEQWISSVLPLADIVLTISQASASDIERYAAERGFALRDRPRVIPMGTGFTTQRTAAGAEPRGARLPPAGSYALIVGTIEARKNHALLFRVWRRLLDEMPRGQVPTLVFAGRVGWLVSDLMLQLRNCDFLGGKIVLIEDPTDVELAQLYDGCQFSLFPSFHEGWGLPVTESFAHGRPCIISRATSLPEAGGTLARYIDPDSVTDACRVIRATIEDPAGIAEWHRRVAREFVPVTWEQSARAVLRAMAPPPAPALALALSPYADPRPPA